MKIIESWILAYLLNSLWQVPLLFCGGLLAARLARPISPQIEHRVWVGTLLLQILLPLCNLQFAPLWQSMVRLLPSHTGIPQADGQVQTFFTGPVMNGFTLNWMPAQLSAAVIGAYICILIFFAVRMGMGVWKVLQLRRRAALMDLSHLPVRTNGDFRLKTRSDYAQIACSAEIAVPAAMGIQQQTLLMPTGFVEQLCCEDLSALLAHEFAHMERNDFAKNLFYSFISLPIAFHPVRALTLMRIAETRELICDRLAAHAIGSAENYARSLLRLASVLSGRTAPKILHAVGIFDANIFERRIMNLTRKGIEIGRVRRALIVTTCVILGIATCASALALRVGVAAPDDSSQAPKIISVKQSDLSIANKVQPIYPAEAKKNKDTVNGTVLLSVVIGKDGTVENIEVAKSLRADYDQSALVAVRQWKWQPYLLNGDPAEVKTTVTVIYSIEK